MAKKISSVNLLPEFLRTERNSKFLSSTIDQLIQPPQLERIDAYVGSTKTPTYNSTADIYISNGLPYQLDPALITRDNLDNIKNSQGYDDLINEISSNGGYTNNLDRLFRSEVVSYNPHIDWDKLVNYQNYYWIPEGPDLIDISINNAGINNLLGSASATVTVQTPAGQTTTVSLSNGMLVSFTGVDIAEQYQDQTFFVEGVGKSIKLVPFKWLLVSENFLNPFPDGWDSHEFDNFPFDNDREIPIIPEYVTINRASQDKNSWSRYNRWVHKDVIKVSAELNGYIPKYSNISRAQRPIIEFLPDIKLFDYGTIGLEPVDIFDQEIEDISTLNNSTTPVYLDGIEVEEGHRVIFASATNQNVAGKIYQAQFTNSGSTRTLNFIPAYDHVPVSGATIAVLLGTERNGTEWWFTGTEWKFGQQKTTVNQSPLFDLFDVNENSYGNKEVFLSNFAGNKIFSYAVGTGTIDQYLRFPIVYKNTQAIGSIVFENNLSTDEIIISQLGATSFTVLSNVGYVKVGDKFENAWVPTVDYAMPVLTSTATGISSYYEEPLSLTNNPLNGIVAKLTISDLTEHVNTMVNRLSAGGLYNPALNNLRDFADYSNYGIKLISSINPIAFAQMFIGKKENSVIDAITKSANKYNKFKLSFLNGLNSVTEQLSPSDAVDQVLTSLNQTTTGNAPYYYSDMVPYGTAEINKSWKVTNPSNVSYPLTAEFDLDALSMRSVLVYLNGQQLVYGNDYVFNKDNASVDLSVALSVDDVVLIKDFTNTEGSYVPPTPTKLGLYPKYVPSIYYDDTYANGAIKVIQCHDGSTIVAYNDYRDLIILELEKRIYNNIKSNYRPELLDINSVIPGQFRTTNYSLNEVNNIIQGDFVRWASEYNIDFSGQRYFDANESRTWNFAESFNSTLDQTFYGSWNAIFKQLYDTDRPHTHPWEMLGLSVKPSWWDTYYSWTSGVKRTALINALTLGLTQEPPSTVVNVKYARPALSSILPVNSSGQLIDPTAILSGTTEANKRKSWQVGDQGAAEVSWRRSSYYPFAIQRLLALTIPATYSSLMYDVSRLQKNISDQWVYGDDKTFLKFKNLPISGENGSLTSGYSAFVSEIGQQRTADYLATLREDLTYASYNLFFKVGGFVDKDTLQIIIDAIEPNSVTPGSILPVQNYKLQLNVGNPIKSVAVTGLVVQKVDNTYVIKGYDTQNPYFTCLTPIRNLNTPAINVGGITESYVVWEESGTAGGSGLSAQDTITANAAPAGNFYQTGQYVFYGNNFYKVKVAHRSGPVFNPEYFQPIPKIPTVGGVTVQSASSFSKNETTIPYGVSYTNIQDVYDLIVGYGQWLVKQGFVFDDYNADLESVMDWSLTAKEFLFWTTQNWNNGSIITLSPFADRLVYRATDSIVNNIFDSFYDYSILRADGTPFAKESLSISRLEDICTISTLPNTDGIYFARLKLVRKEHAMVFDNETIFGDTIYNVETGSRQRRIKLVGFRTAGWNGDYFSPGFVYDTAVVVNWKQYQGYVAGSVVRFGGNYYSALKNVSSAENFNFDEWSLLREKPTPGLLPNFDYKINQFEDFYSVDSDNFDETQQQLAQHLVGYTPRVYLNNIFSDQVSQFKFYQGFIKDKGTRAAITALSKVGVDKAKGAISFNEEWAFRVGNFGSFPAYSELEVPLVEGTFLESPQIVNFVNQLPEASENDLLSYIVPADLSITPKDYNPESVFSTTSTDLRLLLSAGYVRLDDVTATAYNENSFLDIANSNQLVDGDTLWLGFKQDGNWDVYRYTYIPAAIIGVYISAPVSTITFTTQFPHGLSVGDIIGIKQFNDQVNGIYIVQDTTGARQFTVASDLAAIENAPLESPGQLYIFSSARFTNFDSLPSDKIINRFAYGTKFWVDETDVRGWEVYEKINNYDFVPYYSSAQPQAPALGFSISKRKGSDIVVAGAPRNYRGAQYGIVWFYDKQESGELKPLVKYRLGGDYPNLPSGFGSVVVYDDIEFTDSTYGLIFASAPLVDSSSGVVKISSINSRILTEGTSTYITNPDSVAKQFGSSIFVERNTSTKTVLIGADSAAYAYTVSDVGGTIAVSTPVKVFSTTTYAIAGADDASSIAIGSEQKVFVFDKLLRNTDILTSTHESFGKTLAMSPLGDYLFVGIPQVVNTDESLGQVDVYKKVNGKFVYNQTLENPVQGAGMNFGKVIDVTSGVDTLVISALGINYTFPTTFDNNQTIFDGGVTDFTGTTANSGAVYVYYKQDNRFVLSQELTNNFVAQNPGTNYGISLAVDDTTVLVGSPALDNTAINSGFFKFDKIDSQAYSLSKIRYQEDQVDISTIQKITLIDTEKEQVIEYLDIIDPLKGKIAGIAEQELKYKLISDPAIYSIGLAGVNVDTNKNWLDDHVGELWWDLSTAKYTWYEQSSLEYRRNSWGKLFPGASIDVYEWVRTTLLPTEWSSIADTPAGLANNVSGQPKFSDNSVISVKQVYDTVTNSFSNVYYYWVKNKVVVPDSVDRRISGYEVASIIADPSASGLKFISVISKDAVALSNIGPMLVGDKISLSIAQNSQTISTIPPKHTEWVMLQENSAASMPPALLEKKLIDSLLGHDKNGIVVPDVMLTDRTRYGTGIRPQQTLFKNRYEALRNIIEFSNSVLIDTPVTGNYSFANLNAQEQIPDQFENQYDEIVEDNSVLEDVNTSTFVKAIINCSINGSGTIDDISIANPGSGYGTINPVYNANGALIGYQGPVFTDVNYDTLFDSGTTTFDLSRTDFLQGQPSPYGRNLEISTVVNNQGSIISASVLHGGKGYKFGFKLISRPHTVFVESDETYNGKWSRFEFDYLTKSWIRAQTQSFNTQLYWNYVDWADSTYNKFKIYSAVIGSPYELSEIEMNEGEYVKINNSGDGRYIVLEKSLSNVEGTYGNGYNLVYKQNGTIQIDNKIWDLSNTNLSWDNNNTYDETLWDQTPDIELQYILDALKNDIFIDDLKINWNKLFFKSVRYALTEQKMLDWAFKTSFITVVHDSGELEQPPVYKLRTDENYEKYINEVKPYHTQIRNFVDKNSLLEKSNTEAIELSSTSTVALKFDRISTERNTGDFSVTDLFVCNGVDTEFVLSWVPNPDKLKITVKVDKLRVLSSEYTIVYYSQLFNGYTKKYAKLVFLNEIPIDANKVISIQYKKSAEVLNAVDRVLSYYTATSGMVGLDLGMLMYGIDYPGVQIGGQYEGVGFANSYGGTYPSTLLSAGTWTNGISNNALGTSPAERIIDGEFGFLSPNSGHAPEEVVPGSVIDGLGINVYTQGPAPSPTVYSGSFDIPGGGGVQRFKLSILPPTVASMSVILNGVYLKYTEGLLNPGLTVYSIDWGTSELLIPPQETSGTLGYTIIGVGGSDSVVGLIDYAIAYTDGAVSSTVESSVSDQIVKDAFVSVNGYGITTSTAINYTFGYNQLTGQATVTVRNLPLDDNIIQVWFFGETHERFNEIREQVFVVTGNESNTFTLLYPPEFVGPESTNAIVEVTTVSGTRRLLPPDDNLPGVYDYTIVGDQLIVQPSAQLVASDTIKVITFSNHDSMSIQVDKFFGSPERRFVLDRPVLNNKYIWVTLNKFDGPGNPPVTYGLINGLDFVLFEDNVTVQLSDDWVLTIDDIVGITTIVNPTHPTNIIGYRIFNDMFGGTTFTRLSLADTARLTKPLRNYDTEIHVSDGSILTAPIITDNVPGVVLINGERVEFFEIDGNVLKQITRGTMGTSPADVVLTGSRVIDQGTKQHILNPETVYVQNTFTNTLTNIFVIDKISSDMFYPTTTSTLVRHDGIVLSTLTNVAPVDQVEVYYGGKQLSKFGKFVADISVSYDIIPEDSVIATVSSIELLPTSADIGDAYLLEDTNKVWVYTGTRSASTASVGWVYSGLTYVDPEFTVLIGTDTRQQLILNTDVLGTQSNIQVTIVKKDFSRDSSWSNIVSSEATLSLLDSTTPVAEFLKDSPTELPHNYYGQGLLGEDNVLRNEAGEPLLNEQNNILTGNF